MNKKIEIKKIIFSATNDKHIDALYNRVSKHIDSARRKVQTSIDIEMVNAYWFIGRDIVNEEQRGKKRADYGSYIIKELSERLKKQYSKGFGISTLKDIRQFYLAFSEYLPIGHAVRGRSKQKQLSPNLGWIHYRSLMRVPRLDAQRFYAVEAEKNNWSGRELERQINSLLFERLAKSRDKKGLLKLANKGHQIVSPMDAIKEPVILEFLDLPESHRLVESKLEEALINNLQSFLLELGKGFAFIARQKRLTFDGDHFYADLVFYHAILKCYIVIDIKNKKISHADLGQISLYVNYFDQEVKMENDNPTVGLVLCTDKSDGMVKYTLGDKAKQIFASTYRFHLPTEKELEHELKREIKQIKRQMIKKDKTPKNIKK